MPDAPVASARRIVAGAAHGAWIALLLGVLFLMVTWAVFITIATFAPRTIPVLVGMEMHAVWALVVRWYAGLKLLLVGWALLASFLSYWWRSL